MNGLLEGDVVAVPGDRDLRDGMRVDVVNMEAEGQKESRND
jgi:hypothetical protein